MPRTTFTTTLRKGTSKDVMGIVVPPESVEALGPGKRPPVTVTLKGYTYRSTVAVMGGKFLLPLAKVHREGSGAKDGETVKVTLELDSAPREVAVPKDLKAALAKGKVLKAFEAASYTNRKEWVRGVEEAKAPETRERRIAKIVGTLAAKA
ncbi:MAG: YdeI/OmpD-associated family protein [Vicinamibacterales bacterium]